MPPFSYGNGYYISRSVLMFFLLPVAAATAITVGEAIGIGATVFGIGAGVKGMLDYQKAKKLKAEADEEYRKMASRIRHQAIRLKKSLQRFGRLKLEAYTLVIGNAVKILSAYKTIDLTAYKSVTIESIRFINAELENLEKSCIQASDVLNCISVGINTALHDNIPYKNTPILIETIGALGVEKSINGLPNLPYAAMTMAGVTWAINGSIAKTKAEETSVETKIETQRMACVLSGLKAIENRVTEGERLLYALSGKLKTSIGVLQSLESKDNEFSEESAQAISTSINLIKSLKQLIETDICNTDGFLTNKSGIIFRKIKQEVYDA